MIGRGFKNAEWICLPARQGFEVLEVLIERGENLHFVNIS